MESSGDCAFCIMNYALRELFPLCCYLKWVEIGDFFDFFFVGEECSLASKVKHELSGCIALKVGSYALLMARGVDL